MGHNPVAPIPAERDEICRLIERDESLVKILTKEKQQRETLVEQNESKEAIAADCLASINADLARATELRSILVETLKGIKLFEDGPMTKTPASHNALDVDYLPHNSVPRTPVPRIANSYHKATTGHLSEIEDAIEKATSTAARYSQEVRAAQSLSAMSRDDIKRIASQINECITAIVTKKFRLKAIWCVPDEVWETIFQHSTDTINSTVNLDDEWIHSTKSWHGALVVSAVCRRWGAIATASPQLWAKITVFRGTWRPHDLSRVRCYIERAGDSAKTLLLGGTQRVDRGPVDELNEMMKKCSFVERIICRVAKGHINIGLTSVLECLPAAPELWLLRETPHTGPALEPSPYYYVSLPDLLAIKVERLVTETLRVGGGLGSPRPHLHSCSIICPSVYVSFQGGSPFERSIGRFLATSLPTLKVLRLTAPQFAHELEIKHVADTLLETLHITLPCLFLEFAPRYTMPNLQNLVITGGPCTTLADYEPSKARLPLKTLQSLTIESASDPALLTVLILDATSLSSLELGGNSVDLVLSSLVKHYHDNKKPFLVSLRGLTIHSYAGDGRCILDFLEAWMASHAAILHALEVIMFADDCPSVTLETRKRIWSLSRVEIN